MKFLEKVLSSGLYLLVFLLTLQTRLFIRPGELNGGYWEYGSIALYATDLLLIIVLSLFIIPKFLIFNLPAGEAGFKFLNRFKIQKISLLIIGLNLISLASIFFAADKLVAVQAYIRLTLGMGLFYLVSQAVYDYVKLIYAFLAGATVQASLGIWQFLSQSTFAYKWLGLAAHPAEVGGNSVIETISGGRWLRAYGGLDHPNVLGGLLAISLLLIVYLMLRDELGDKIFNPPAGEAGFKFTIFKQFLISKFLIKQILFYLLFFIYLTALFFTFSRGAWIGLAVGLIVILAFNVRAQNRQGIRKLIILGAGTIVLAGVLFFNFQDLITTRLSGTARLEIKSNQERAASYRDAANVIKNNWLAGVGIGGYTRSLVKLYSTEPSWFYQPTHNVFLLVWAELGIIGLLLVFAIIVYVIKKGYALCVMRYENANDLNDGIFKLSIILCLIILMLPDHYLWSLHFGVLLFWFLLGLAARIEPQTDLTDEA